MEDATNVPFCIEIERNEGRCLAGSVPRQKTRLYGEISEVGIVV